MNLALLGKNITHSKSPELYKKLVHENINYQLLDFENIENIPPLNILFRKYNLNGLNITSPYKEIFLNDVIKDIYVEDVQALNCIRNKGDRFESTNTDYLAVDSLLKKYLVNYEVDKVVLLGNGVMGRLTHQLLKKLEIDYIHYYRSRDGDLNEINYQNINQRILLINSCARDFKFSSHLPSESVFWDYNYALPEHSHQDFQYIDGLSLLELQAKYAAEFFLDT